MQGAGSGPAETRPGKRTSCTHDKARAEARETDSMHARQSTKLGPEKRTSCTHDEARAEDREMDNGHERQSTKPTIPSTEHAVHTIVLYNKVCCTLEKADM